MPLLPLDEATPILDRLRHVVQRIEQADLHVLSPVERIDGECWVRCSCGCLWSGDRAIDAPQVCAVAELDADLLADLTRLLDSDSVGRERLRLRQSLEKAHLKGSLSLAS